ncbi:C40 family peptidase [Nocardioides sp.]|uniref:C40 family peptidase n=1 Tax=Nocardioides sp. TaxID=35761 RepID=UPI002637354F|nr:C40 family peptidase [Nocardioides sp.]
MRTKLALLLVTFLSVALVGLIPTPAHATTAAPITIHTASVKRAAVKIVSHRIINVAASRKGTPYRYGGTTTSGFDCSGYTRWVFKRLGVSLPHQSAAQVSRTYRVRHPRIGDLVFFTSGGHVYHVGIYAGSHKVWHAPYTGARVRKERIWTGSVFYGRVKGLKKALTNAAWKIVKKARATHATNI